MKKSYSSSNKDQYAKAPGKAPAKGKKPKKEKPGKFPGLDSMPQPQQPYYQKQSSGQYMDSGMYDMYYQGNQIGMTPKQVNGNNVNINININANFGMPQKEQSNYYSGYKP